MFEKHGTCAANLAHASLSLSIPEAHEYSDTQSVQDHQPPPQVAEQSRFSSA
jgi:hypothetical protein